jgi:hypothetical protein
MLFITLAYQYASYYRSVLVRYCHDAIGLLVRLYVITAACLYKGINMLIITLAYQYTDFTLTYKSFVRYLFRRLTLVSVR